MSLATAQALTAALGLYALIGAGFALYFVAAGAQRVNADAVEMPWRARAVIFPAAAGLWPLLLVKLLIGRRA